MSSHLHPTPNTEDDAATSRLLTGLAIGGALATAAVILAPNILPTFGVGNEHLFDGSMWVFHGKTAGAALEGGGTLALADAGTGLAGIINQGIAQLPVIGEQLAGGGWFTALTSLALGTGGTLLGQFIAQGKNGERHIKWGSVIKYGALITSALVALPTLLTSVSMGISFLVHAAGNNAVTDAIVGVVSYFPGISGAPMIDAVAGLSGAAAAIPHLLTCAAAFLPAALAYSLDHNALPAIAVEPRNANIPATAPAASARIEVDAPAKAGTPCYGRLILTNAQTGAPLSAEELATVHSKKIHMFVVDQSLKDMHHIHPQATDTPGVFSFSFTPNSSNHYTAWSDITLQETGENYKLSTVISGAANRNMVPSIRTQSEASAGGLNFHWKNNEPLTRGGASVVEVDVTDAAGKPITDLEPVMGSYAHLMGFSADGKSMIHSHPLGAEPTAPSDRGGSKLRFIVHPEQTDAIQFHLQVKHQGKDITVPIGQRVQAPAQAVERISHLQPAMAMAR